MKKIILGIVFVFASFTMVNANSDDEIIDSKEGIVSINSYEPCVTLADDITLAVKISINGFVNHIDEISLWVRVYDACILSAIRDMQEPDEDDR